MSFPRQRLFWAVGLGHMTVDMFNSIAPVLLTFLSAHLVPLSNTQIGVAISAYQFAGAVSQPYFGWVGDKTGGRWLGGLGVAWTVGLIVVSMIVLQITQSYWLMLPIFVLGALGSAAFHPIGAMHASDVDESNAPRNTAYFFLMGQLGLAAGPALIGYLLDQFATHNNAVFTNVLGTPFSGVLIERGTIAPLIPIALIALPVVLMMILSIPTRKIHEAARALVAEETIRRAKENGSLPIKILALFVVIVALRSLVSPGMVPFIPRLFEQKGWDATSYGFVTSIYWLGGGIAGIIVGNMAKRFDSRYLIAFTLILAAPMTFLLPFINSPLAFPLMLAVGALSGGSHSLLVVFAQNLLPGRKGLASGAILGFMFAAGAIGTMGIGAVADLVSLNGAFQVVAATTLVSGVLTLLLPTNRRRVAKSEPIREAEPEAVRV